MTTIKHPITVDARFIISVMPDDLRNEFTEMLRFHEGGDELSEWWLTASDDEVEQIAYNMMNDDYLWSVWKESLRDAMKTERHNIKIRNAIINSAAGSFPLPS